MPATPPEIARRALADHLAALPPAELLKRYATRRDPEAFAGLVQQFGPLVLGACRRVLGPAADVDDAFQAVFLALARQADSFRDAAALPAWLHRVALRTSRKALNRRDNPAPLPDAVADPTDPFADVAWKDVRRVLDEELDRLPDKYRGPVVLCWLDGLTQDEAAGRVGVSLATLKRRLEAGRALLRTRLLSRGLAPVLVAAAVADPIGLKATVPDALKVLAVELGVPGAAVPAGVEALRVAVAVTAPARSYLKVALALVLVGGVATAGVLGVTNHNARLLEESPKREPEPESESMVRFDGPEDPLPPGAVARFGTARYRVPGQINTLAEPSPARNWNPSWAKPTALSRDGRHLAVAARGAVFVYETATWKLVYRLNESPGEGTDHLSSGPVFLSPGAEYIAYRAGATLHSDIFVGHFGNRPKGTVSPMLSTGALYAHHTRTGRTRKLTNDGTGLLGFTTDGLFMLAGTGCIDPASGAVVRPLPAGVWDGNANRPGVTVPRVEVVNGVLGRNRGVVPSPDGTLLAEVVHHGYHVIEVTVWRADPWEQVGKFRLEEKRPEPVPGEPVPALAEEGDVPADRLQPRAAWVAEDNRSVAVKTRDGDLARWDLTTGRELPRLVEGNKGGALNYHVLPGGRILTPCWKGTVRIWDAVTGREIEVPNRYVEITHVRSSDDGRVIAVADVTGRFDVLDGDTGGRIQRPRPTENRVGGLAVSGDGKTIAVRAAYPPSKLRFIDSVTGRECPERAFPIDEQFAFPDRSWTPDRQVRAEADRTTVKITGRVQRAFDVDSRDVVPDRPLLKIDNVVLSPDARRVLLTFEAGRVLTPTARPHYGIWDVGSGAFVARVPPSDTGYTHKLFTSDGKSLITFATTDVGYRWDIEKLIAAQKK